LTTLLRIAALAVPIGFGAVAACGGEGPADSDVAPELREGRDLYRSQCASCHGSTGGGGVGSALDDGRMAQRYPDIADQIAVVSDGRGMMPGFGGFLSDAQLEAVVRFTREGL
jgi:mono/diheme cytochrome c family protein